MRTRNIHARQFRIGSPHFESSRESLLPRDLLVTTQRHTRLRNRLRRLHLSRSIKPERRPLVRAPAKPAIKYFRVSTFIINITQSWFHGTEYQPSMPLLFMVKKTTIMTPRSCSKIFSLNPAFRSSV